jgi:hypothetical protein
LLAAVIDNVEINLRAFNEAIETDLMNGLDMYKDVTATVVSRAARIPQGHFLFRIGIMRALDRHVERAFKIDDTRPVNA